MSQLNPNWEPKGSKSATSQRYGPSSKTQSAATENSGSSETSRASGSTALLPSVTKPSGGGSIKGMNEAFSVEMISGTASMSIPIPATEIARWGTPQLSLSYDSGAGNGPFGIGWHLQGIPSIQRSTRKRLPTYSEQDSFEYAGDELVPVVSISPTDGKETPDQSHIDGFTVQRYRPVVDSQFDRIERWTLDADPDNVHWRVLSPQNETQIFGQTQDSRIFCDTRIKQWLLCEAYDNHGGSQLLQWKSEDALGIDDALLHEIHRIKPTDYRNRCKYLKRIKYGNSAPNRKSGQWDKVIPAAKLPEVAWHFELVFDYGEHNIDTPLPNDDSTTAWTVRKDPFSTYLSGFEVRTYRLCRQVLMFHHFEKDSKEQGGLVSQLTFKYNEDATMTCLSQVQLTGIGQSSQAQSNTSKSLPPLEFEYTKQQTSVEKLTSQEFTGPSTAELGSGALENLQWIDLAGDGITGALFQENGSWYWKPNLSKADSSSEKLLTGEDVFTLTASLGGVQQLPSHPSLSSTLGPGSSVSLMDIDGDGRLELVSTNPLAPGYYHAIDESEKDVPSWQEFKAFDSWPNVYLEDPNLRMVDITGNGLADILITEDDRLVWYYSLGIEGYTPPEAALHALQEEKSPRVLFSDPEQSIHLADLSGDGLVDIARIKNGQVCYWPNLGYGRFGSKVTMSNSPAFDKEDMFNHEKILLCDVDGSGTTDIIYFNADSANIYYNESGNSWGNGISLKSILPPYDSMSKVTTVDLFGTGTTCLVWSTSIQSLSQPLVSCLRYVDLTGGVKPHLLKSWKNNQGLEISMLYRSSTSYYLQDRLNGTPWVTTIPFPVQCIDTVMRHDFINCTLSVDKYSYHHGYYDGVEREFHGFGRVEHWNSEEYGFFDKNQVSSSLNIEKAAFTAPVHTKTWYHVGAFENLDKLRSMYDSEFNTSIPNRFKGFTEVLSSELGAGKYTSIELKEASRALKGAALHTESYADSKETGIPFAVEDTCTNVRMIQHCGKNRRPIFQIFPTEVFTTVCDGNTEDPLFKQELNLEVDGWGNVTKAAKINYGRLKQNTPDADLKSEDIERQEKLLIVYKEATFTQPIDKHPNYLAPIPYSEVMYELNRLPRAKDRYQSLDFAAAGGDFSPIKSLAEIKYTAEATQVPSKRLISSNIIRYRSADLKTLLDPQIASPLALPGQSWTLCLTPEILSVFKDTGLNVAADSPIFAEAGYEKLGEDGNWWIKSPEIKYSLSDTNELEEAESSFFMPKRITTAFKSTSTTEYDPFWLIPIASTDAVGNRVEAVINYHYLAPISVNDPNGNITEIEYEAFGRIVAIAEAGKGGADANTTNGIDPNPSTDAVRAYFRDPLTNARSVLKDASIGYIYDDSAYMDNSTPASVSEIKAVFHGKKSSRDILLSISYQDATGHVIQIKTSTTNNKWCTSGWSVYNNKGLVVQTFDPYLGDSPEYEPNKKIGYSSITFYDSLDREIAVIHPDHTWTKTVYRTWSTVFHNPNSLTNKNPADDPDVGPAIVSLGKEVYSPTWYTNMKASASCEASQAAADKSLKHQNTPRISFYDSMGKSFSQVNTMNKGDAIRNRSYCDAQGFETSTLDALNRVATKSHSDMLGRVLKVESLDNSPRTSFLDIDGKPVYQWINLTDQLHFKYDETRRPAKTLVGKDAKSEICISELIYGDSLKDQDPKTHNLCGQLYTSRDQAGEVIYSEFDLGGRCISSTQKLSVSYNSVLDWNHDVELDQKPYESSGRFDALGRILTVTAADGTVTEYSYDVNGLLFSVKTQASDGEIMSYVSSIEYDEHHREVQRENKQSGVKEIKKYDPKTYRLAEEICSQGPDTIQHFAYTYDASGNLVYRQNKAAPKVWFGGTIINGDNDYTYDSANRLATATGREHLGQTQGQASGPAGLKSLSKMAKNLSANDMTALARYTEIYTYDPAGNIETLEHQTTDTNRPGWTRVFKYENPSLLALPGSKIYNNRLSWSKIGKEGNAKDEYEYDGTGNLIKMPSLLSAKWDFKNQLRYTVTQNSKKEQRKVW